MIITNLWEDMFLNKKTGVNGFLIQSGNMPVLQPNIIEDLYNLLQKQIVTL